MSAKKLAGQGALTALMQIIKGELAEKQSTLAFDSAPTEGSSNAVTSGGVYTAIQEALGGLDTVLAGIVGGD